MQVPKIIQTISEVLEKQNAKAIIVGGSVRDHFLKLPYKDIDIEVYGLDKIEELENILSKYGSVNLVGKSFGVLKFVYEKEEYDFSFPRVEYKVGEGHRGFDVKVDGLLDFETAAKRRDFTVNALGYDVRAKKFLDPFGGLGDIKQKNLRHIDDTTFVEDPLRVYRAVQFSARFSFSLVDKTFTLCKSMVDKGMLDELAKERVYDEWKKLLLKSKKPSHGFELMRELGIMEYYFPELYTLIGVVQSSKWHPEGDVWIHTMMTLDEMVKLCRVDSPDPDNEKQKLKYMFAILCHDLGKATHTLIDEEGHISSRGHDQAGLEPTKSLMGRLTEDKNFIDSILPFVKYHLHPSQFYRNRAKSSAIRRLAIKVNIEELVVVARADFLGRTTKEALMRVYEAGDWLLEKSRELKVESKPLDNLLQGRDLIELGLKPSPRFKEILNEVYAMQLDGKLTSKNVAIAFVKKSLI